MQVVGVVKPGVVSEKTFVQVIALHGSMGPIECVAPGFVVPNGEVGVTGTFSYGGAEVDQELGEDQIDLHGIRFDSGQSEIVL